MKILDPLREQPLANVEPVFRNPLYFYQLGQNIRVHFKLRNRGVGELTTNSLGKS